jgi:hypothetical protein
MKKLIIFLFLIPLISHAKQGNGFNIQRRKLHCKLFGDIQ